MLTALIASMSAVLYGTADFLGGFTSRRDAAFVVTFAAQATGLALVAAITVVAPPASWTDPRIMWGLGAGVFGGGGVLALYAGLATGRMSVVGPVAAALTGAIPAAFGLATGDAPGPLGVLGMVLAFVAIVIVSVFAPDEGTGSGGQALAFALLAGSGFGISVLCWAQTPASTSFAPLLVARTTTILVFAGIIVVRGGRFVPVHSARGLAVLTGCVDVAANAWQVIALRIGPVALASVIGAMYPVVTVLLARVVLREHLHGWQRVGVALALVAVGLSAVG